ncbi:hypothetical protein ACO2RV_24400 [Ancylobacter sp. VNQ12]|uniref:hypothetical protein n=1 Tax=Ancylobacter sp. VNQ12 TaxID=3400920 RepID=UPI003C0D9509
MRTAEPAPFLPTLRRLTAEAREKIAADLLGLDQVREAMTQAAYLGRERLFLRPKTPVDLRGTTAATTLTEHLAKLGAIMFWHPYTADQDGHPTTGHELEIAWHERR